MPPLKGAGSGFKLFEFPMPNTAPQKIIWKDPSKLKKHPLNNLREMNARELNSLVRSMEWGFNEDEPITLYKGKVLDGWSRTQAAIKAGIEWVPCETKKFKNEEDAKWYVDTRNSFRRQLSPDEFRARWALWYSENVKQGKRQLRTFWPKLQKLVSQTER
jgi:hypothetical protein